MHMMDTEWSSRMQCSGRHGPGMYPCTMYDECMAELMMRHSLFFCFFGRYKHCIFALLTDDALATARCATTPVLSGTQAYIHCMRVASGLVAR